MSLLCERIAKTLRPKEARFTHLFAPVNEKFRTGIGCWAGPPLGKMETRLEAVEKELCRAERKSGEADQGIDGLSKRGSNLNYSVAHLISGVIEQQNIGNRQKLFRLSPAP